MEQKYLTTFSMFLADCTGNAKNNVYRNRVTIATAEDLAAACRKDHVCVAFANCHRSNGDYIRGYALAADCDNDFTEDPAEWITPEMVAAQLPDVAFYAVKSRNCDKVKHPGEPGEKSARPRYHYYFPFLVPVEGYETARKLADMFLAAFPMFDDEGTKPAQFFYGHAEPVAVYYPGEMDITEYFHAHPVELEPEPEVDVPTDPVATATYTDDFAALNIDDMLSKISAACDHGTWYKVGMAIKAAGLPFEIWDSWSSTAPDLYPGVVKTRKKWLSFKGGKITFGTLVHLAKQNGWKSDPDKLTGEYKKNHDGAAAHKAKTKRFQDKHREEHRAALAAIGITAEDPYIYTWTTDTDGSIAEVTEKATGEIVYTKPAPDPEVKPLPEWLIVRQWQGRDVIRINEPLFSEMFQREYKVNRINGVFYMDGKAVTDDEVLMLVQQWIAKHFVENTGKLTHNVFLTLSNSVYTKQPEPDESKIYCKNNITITVRKDGTFDFKEEDIFTLTRIGASYTPGATCPTFHKYLEDLFYDEDIPAVQEYFGYCLIPCTRAQAGLFVKGKGGEGKSVMRDVSMALFGNAAIQEYVHQIGERFNMANLENKLVMVDDDLRSDLLSDTSTLKKLITAREKFQVERKHKDKYDAYLYSRIIAIGNTFIGSKFDHSDGFYRRQLLVDVKPKTRDEKNDDRFMSDKCIAEIDGILNWALEGLSRLITNNYHFSVSDRMTRTLDDIKHDGDNTLAFFEDSMYITKTDDWTNSVTSADMFTLYAIWCDENGDVPVKRKTFLMRMSDRLKDYKIRVDSKHGRVNAYATLLLTHAGDSRLMYLNEKESERIKRLP